MEPERPSDLAQDLAALRRSLEGCGSEASSGREALARIERASKTQRLDFASFQEMAGRINAQGLDLGRIEAYVTTLLRGRTGAAAVWLLRAGPEEGVLASTRGVERRLPLDAPLARKLLELGRPVLLAAEPLALGDDLGPFADAALVAPLVQREASERVLRGVLALGPKMTGKPHGARDIEFLGLISELVAIALHNAYLHYTATHDALTETWSRGYFDVELGREVARSERRRAKAEPATFSLVLLDLDFFKKVNDTYGHRAGDRVLQLVARTLKKTIREYDTLCRWGGEEFAIVLPDVPKARAVEAAERFRKAVREARTTGDRGEDLPPITASLGVASWPDDGALGRDLILKADEALYHSKANGRDRVSGA